MKLLFVFNRHFQSTLEYRLKSDPGFSDDLKIITFSSELRESLEKKYNLHWKNIDDYLSVDQEEKINRDAILWLHQKSQEEFQPNVCLVNYFLYQNVSLWWISGYLYLYNDIINTIYTIELLTEILKQERPELVLIPDVISRQSTKSQVPQNDPNFAYKILYEICAKDNIQYRLLKSSPESVFDWKKRIILDRLRAFVFSSFSIPLFQISRWFATFRNYGNSLKKQTNQSDEKRAVVISPSSNWGEIFDLEKRTRIKGDSKLGYFLQKVKDQIPSNMLGIDANSVVSGEVEVLNDKLNQDEYIRWSSPEYFSDLKTWLKIGFDKKLARRQAKNLLRKKLFQDLFVFKEIPFFKIINSRLTFVLTTLLPDGITKRILYERIFKQSKPDVAVISYETGLHGRAAISAAHKMEIPTLAIQHGKIHGSHPQYIHMGVSTRNKPDRRYAPIADITAVFGNFTKDVLTRLSAYPPANVEITGSVASDSVPYSQTLYDKNHFRNKLSLSEAYPIVCLMAQNFEKESDSIRFYQTTCESLNNFNNINFIVKLHPTQNQNKVHRLIEKYYQWPEKIKYLQKKDLYEIIFCADIFITGNSTVGLEVLMFGKPLITIEGFKYSMGYAESGASFGIYTKQEMIEALREIFSKSKHLESVLKKSSAYVKEHLFQVDGNASQRVLEIAQRLTKKTKNS